MGAGMEGNGGQVKFEEFHVLNNEGIHTSVPAVVSHLSGSFQLIVIQQSVQRNIHFRIKQSRMTAKFFNVLNRVRGLFAGTKVGASDIDGIRAVVDGGHAHLTILGRRKQFYLLRFHVIKYCISN